MKKKFLLLATIAFSSFIFYSCASVAPVNASYEKAGTLGKGNVEVSGNFTHYIVSGGGESDAINNNYGFRVGYGLFDKVDLKFRYEKLVPVNLEEESQFKVNYMSIIPKFNLEAKKLSLMIPFSRYRFKDQDFDGNTYSIAPQVIKTFTSKSNQADFSVTIKGDYIINTGEDAENDFLLGMNLGAGLSENLDKWAFRPEIGYLFKPGESIGFWNFGFGVQFMIKPRSKK